ncbi:MAG: type II toxin-antitoxin system YafQ family toxin, partial [Campylobacterales bacterium]|nr:type II toxin-antitoxin system YafQ family toxin [Campylobacterales bacterium]
KYKDHLLIGNYKGCRECHVKPDLLLIYKINNDEVELVLVEVGKHSKLFK